MNRYRDLLYKRGFLFTDIINPSFKDEDSEFIFQTWCCLTIGKYKFFYDPIIPIGIAKDKNNMILIAGMVLNPFDSNIDSNEISRILLSYKNSSNLKFIEYLNKLSGRFVIIYKNNDNIEIYGDACSTRTIFYDRYDNNTVVSSHAALIANLLDYEISPECNYFYYNRNYQEAVMKKLPGLITPYDGVYILTPNTRLLLPSRKVERFFPYKDNVPCKDYFELEDELSKLLTMQLKLLSGKAKISMSLTSGIDSRLSLAASKKISKDIEYFTYVSKSNIHIEDVKIARKICSDFNLNHKIYQWDNTMYSDGMNEFDDIWEKNLGIRKGIKWLNKIYADSYPKNRIHIRSNIAEIVKAESGHFENSGFCASQLANLFTTTSMNKDEKVIRKFEEFINITGFSPENLYNYDYSDLFEWEYRMCQWHSLLLLESDMSHDTFLIYNNRDILCKMLSLPYKDRLKRKIFIGIIKRKWPELLKYPVNNKMLT